MLFSQVPQPYALKGIFLDLNIAYGTSFGELSKRFGPHQSFGLGISYQPAKGLDFGIKYNYFFSKNVREDVLKPYRTDFGQLIGEDFLLTSVQLRERGFLAFGYCGGIIPFGSQHKNRQGVRWMFGPGFIQHRIRIQDDSRSVTQLYSDFGRGLDRLTNGFCIVNFVGYELRSSNGRINVYSGFEAIWGFTSGKREWDYDKAESSLGIKRKDNLIQFKLGWYIPYFIKKSELIEY